LLSFFFLQAEGGIRDFHVTGVQTCALPICPTWTNSGATSTASSVACWATAGPTARADPTTVGAMVVAVADPASTPTPRPPVSAQIGRASSRERGGSCELPVVRRR